MLKFLVPEGKFDTLAKRCEYSVMSHFLPPETLCPIKNEPLVREGRAEVKKRSNSERVYVTCKACGSEHAQNSFSDEDALNAFNMTKADVSRVKPRAKRKILASEPEVRYVKPEEANQKTPTPEPEVRYVKPEEAKRKTPAPEPECPPKPLDEDEHQLKDTFRKTCDEIADMFQAKVDASQPTPGKKKDNSATYKKQIWLATFRDSSIFIALCPCCNIAPITRDEFQLGHIHPESRGGTDERKNVMPICAPCNNIMGTRHLYAYAWYTYGRVLWSTV